VLLKTQLYNLLIVESIIFYRFIKALLDGSETDRALAGCTVSTFFIDRQKKDSPQEYEGIAACTVTDASLMVDSCFCFIAISGRLRLPF